MLSWAMRPSARIAARRGIAAIVAARNCRQVLISAGIGLFSGGTQRTALAIAASTSVEAVVGSRSIGARREAEFDQRSVEEVAGVVAGERPAGAVGAAQARREADDQKPRVAAPKVGTGALCQAGSAARHSSRKATRRGQSGQSRPGSVAVMAGRTCGRLGSDGLVVLELVLEGGRRLGALGLALGALGRVAADLRLQRERDR